MPSCYAVLSFRRAVAPVYVEQDGGFNARTAAGCELLENQYHVRSGVGCKVKGERLSRLFRVLSQCPLAQSSSAETGLDTGPEAAAGDDLQSSVYPLDHGRIAGLPTEALTAAYSCSQVWNHEGEGGEVIAV